MSLPPQILRIKRKRDDLPVDALYIETSTKRRLIKSPDFIFRRLLPKSSNHEGQSTPASFPLRHSNAPNAGVPEDRSSSNGIPQVLATRPGEEDAILQRHQRPNSQHLRDSGVGQPEILRRFHLSNIADLTTSTPSTKAAPSLALGKKQRKIDHAGAPVAVFMEERVTKQDTANHTTQTYTSSSSSTLLRADGVANGPSLATIPVRKRPGARAAVRREPMPVARRATNSKSSEGQEVKLQDALQQYALEEFGVPSVYEGRVFDNVEIDAMDFEYSRQHQVQTESGDVQMEDQEYIYDTYVRQAAHDGANGLKASASMDTYAGSLVSGAPNSIGYLVIPESSSSIFFYTPDSDNEDEKGGDWDSEQDDENNENYYQADYPEEEDRDDDGEAWSDEEGHEAGDHDGNWDWERKKRDWGWDDGRTRGSGVQHSDDEEDEDSS